MANLDAHFDVTRQNRQQGGPSARKWSSRRTIGTVVLASIFLWMLIFWVAKALLV